MTRRRAVAFFVFTITTIFSVNLASNGFADDLISIKIRAGGNLLITDSVDASDDKGKIQPPTQNPNFSEFDATLGIQLNVDVPIFVRMEGKLDYLPVEEVLEASLSGDAFLSILQVQELFYRKRSGKLGIDDVNLTSEQLNKLREQGGEEQLHVLAGAGYRFDIGDEDSFFNMALALAAGGAYFDWQRPGQDALNAWGMFAGTRVQMKIWKFKNTLRVALVGIPNFNFDPAKEKARDEARIAGSSAVNDAAGAEVYEPGQSNKIGFNDIVQMNYFWNITERLYFEAFQENVLEITDMSLGPEAEVNLRQLPDGTEWRATIGIAATFGAL